MTVKHCRDEANCEGQASFLNFFLTASFLLSVQCHGALMHANKLLHGSRSVVKVNQCGMNFRKYANEAKYGPLGSRHLLMRHVGTTTIWGQDQQNKKSNNYFWSEGKKKSFQQLKELCSSHTDSLQTGAADQKTTPVAICWANVKDGTFIFSKLDTTHKHQGSFL